MTSQTALSIAAAAVRNLMSLPLSYSFCCCQFVFSFSQVLLQLVHNLRSSTLFFPAQGSGSVRGGEKITFFFLSTSHHRLSCKVSLECQPAVSLALSPMDIYCTPPGGQCEETADISNFPKVGLLFTSKRGNGQIFVPSLDNFPRVVQCWKCVNRRNYSTN